MASRKQTSSGAKDLVPWRERVGAYKDKQKSMEKQSGGNFFSFKSGVMALDGNEFPGNEVAVIILGSLVEKSYYEGAYDPERGDPPTCFAFGEAIEDMSPHEEVVKRDQQQCGTCADCPFNEWQSAERGNGKACPDRRRLAVIPAGQFGKNGEWPGFDADLVDGEMAFMRIPPTSLNNWGNYVHSITSVVDAPTFAVVTKVKVVPDSKSQFKVQFELIEELDDVMADEDFLTKLLSRVEEAERELARPYNLDVEEKPAREQRGRGRGGRTREAPQRQQRQTPARGKAAEKPKDPPKRGTRSSRY